MSYEIELKAHIREPDSIVSRLTDAGFRLVDSVAKDDRYYRSENGTEFRLRLSGSGRQSRPDAGDPSIVYRGDRSRVEADDSSTADPGDPSPADPGDPSTANAGPASGIVTHKEKRIRDGVEYNVEREFTVDSSGAFESLCERIGAERFALKRKRGWYLSRDGITAEVVEVDSLGWFLEIEAVIDEASGKTESEAAAACVREVLSQAGVDPSAVESRTYLSMLGFSDTPPASL